jgi:hypothetical protein
MFKNVLTISILLSFFSLPVYAQEKEGLLTMGTMLVSTPIHCAPSNEAKKIFEIKDLVFTGMIDKDNIFKVFINKDKAWTSMLENSAGLTCIYFSGMPGFLKAANKEKKELKSNKLDSLMEGKIKRNTKWSK